MVADAKVTRSEPPAVTVSALSVASDEAVAASRTRSVTSLSDDQSRPVLDHS